MTPNQLLNRIGLLIANHAGRDYVSQEDDQLAETLLDLVLDAPLGPTDPADLNPEPGNGPDYSEVRNPNGSHK